MYGEGLTGVKKQCSPGPRLPVEKVGWFPNKQSWGIPPSTHTSPFEIDSNHHPVETIREWDPLVIKEKISHERRQILISPTKKERREYNRLISAEVGTFFNACQEEDPSQSRINSSTDIICRALNIAMESIAPQLSVRRLRRLKKQLKKQLMDLLNYEDQFAFGLEKLGQSTTKHSIELLGNLQPIEGVCSIAE